MFRPIGLAAVLLLTLASSAANAQTTPPVRVVSDAACPLVLENVTMSPAATGVAIAYSIRNDEKHAVREVVITAAAVNFLGEVVSFGMQPVLAKIAAGSSRQFTIVFADLAIEDAETVAVGVQGVRWSGRRAEWRTALRISGPSVVAARK